MTIDPRSLSSEERAIVDTEARRLRDLGPGRLAEPNKVYICALANMTYFILARRALFGEPASEPYKAETTADRIAADLMVGPTPHRSNPAEIIARLTSLGQLEAYLFGRAA